MAKRKRIILIVLPGTLFLFFVLFAYLSLLGENDRITNVIESFFDSVRRHNYPQTLQYLSRDLRNDIIKDEENFYEICFLLELTLLKKFSLLEHDRYRVEARKAHLWVPYLRDPRIPVSVSLHKIRPRKLADFFDKSAERESIDNLFTVIRENGSWKIKSINYAGSSIGEAFIRLKRAVKLDQYLKKTPAGFRVSAFSVKTEGMTPIENRRLSFIIHKVLRYLGEDSVAGSEDQGHPH